MDVNSGRACHQGARRLSGKANLLKILQRRKITDRSNVLSWDWTGSNTPWGYANTFAFHHVTMVASVPL